MQNKKSSNLDFKKPSNFWNNVLILKNDLDTSDEDSESAEDKEDNDVASLDYTDISTTGGTEDIPTTGGEDSIEITDDGDEL